MSAGSIDDEERIELDALRLENDTLRRHLGRLEEKIQKAEEKVLLDQEQWQTHQEEVPQFRNDRQQLKQDDSSERKIPITTQGFNAPNEVCHLHGILQWLNKAKADIVDNDRSKIQLNSDIRLLYNLLKRAKRERRSYETTITRLERSLADSKARAVELDEELQLQRRSFARVMRSDRDAYEARTEGAQETADRRGRQLKLVMTWVEKAESKYVEALGALSAQVESAGAANLGDLEGFAKNMSAEVCKLREGVATALRSEPNSPDQDHSAPKERKTRNERHRVKTTANPDSSTPTSADIHESGKAGAQWKL